jgi:hypothetical protein
MLTERRPVKTDPKSIDSSDLKKSVSNPIDCRSISEQQHTKYVSAEHLTEVHAKHGISLSSFLLENSTYYVVGQVGKP